MATLEITGAAAKASAAAVAVLAELMLGKAKAIRIDPDIKLKSLFLRIHASNDSRLQQVSR
jgi:hypothetical protein